MPNVYPSYRVTRGPSVAAAPIPSPAPPRMTSSTRTLAEIRTTALLLKMTPGRILAGFVDSCRHRISNGAAAGTVDCRRYGVTVLGGDHDPRRRPPRRHCRASPARSSGARLETELCVRWPASLRPQPSVSPGYLGERTGSWPVCPAVQGQATTLQVGVFHLWRVHARRKDM